MSEESSESCYVCSRGIGHEVDIDLDDPPYCYARCRVCKTDMRFKATQDRECCGHRYVGEDLFRADAYYGAHDDYSDEDFSEFEDWEEEEEEGDYEDEDEQSEE